MYQLLFLEFIGTSELLVILVVALVIFGPRKLPELGRSLGQALHQLRSASEDFKRTWESEARLETVSRTALAPAVSAEQVATTKAQYSLASVDAEAPAEASGDELSYVNREVALEV